MEPIITVTYAQRPLRDLRPVENVLAEIMVKLSLKKTLPTAVTSNQCQNGHLVLSQCLNLPLLKVKQETICKQIKGKIKKVCFFI